MLTQPFLTDLAFARRGEGLARSPGCAGDLVAVRSARSRGGPIEAC